MEDARLIFVDVVHQKHAAAERGERRFHLSAIEGGPGLGRRPFQPFEHARLVTLGLQPTQKPGARVGQSLVVEIDRVLRRQHARPTRRPGPA